MQVFAEANRILAASKSSSEPLTRSTTEVMRAEQKSYA
jgi:hypothetical protein